MPRAVVVIGRICLHERHDPNIAVVGFSGFNNSSSRQIVHNSLVLFFSKALSFLLVDRESSVSLADSIVSDLAVQKTVNSVVKTVFGIVTGGLLGLGFVSLLLVLAMYCLELGVDGYMYNIISCVIEGSTRLACRSIET